MKLKGKWKTDIKMGITCQDRCHKKKEEIMEEQVVWGEGGGNETEIWTGLVDR